MCVIQSVSNANTFQRKGEYVMKPDVNLFPGTFTLYKTHAFYGASNVK